MIIEREEVYESGFQNRIMGFSFCPLNYSYSRKEMVSYILYQLKLIDLLEGDTDCRLEIIIY